jgi:hypothetical protein
MTYRLSSCVRTGVLRWTCPEHLIVYENVKMK